MSVNKIMISPITFIVLASIIVFGGAYTTTLYKQTHDKNYGVVVAYSADPTLKNDEPIKLGYPNSRFSVTCSKTTKLCFLEVEENNKSIVKQFPYVVQEWFNPQNSNRPWHTLDVVYSLPSFNNNSELKFSTNPNNNKHLVDVMNHNGWIAD